MDNILKNFKRKIFNIITLIILINPSFSYLEFKFPYAFKLSNKNIFVIHQLGVSICDETFIQIIATVVTFSESEKITTDASLSKVASTISNGYIICLLNDYIYIFDEEGYLLKKSDSKITNTNIEYYTVTYAFEDSNNIYFTIGFIYNEDFYLYSYKYHTIDKTITKHKEAIRKQYYYIKNNGVSCHNMKYSGKFNTKIQYIISCLYSVDGNTLAIDFYDLTTSKLQKSTARDTFSIILTHKVKYYKATLLPDEENLLIGYISVDGIPYSAGFNINNKKAYSVFNFTESYCQNIVHGFKFNYYPERNESIYTCLFLSNSWTIPNAKILVGNIDEDNNHKSLNYKFDNCEVHGYSVIYIDAKNDYYIISDANCNNELVPLICLYDNCKGEEVKIEEQTEEESIEKKIEEEEETEEDNLKDIIEKEKTNKIEEEQNLNEEEKGDNKEKEKERMKKEEEKEVEEKELEKKENEVNKSEKETEEKKLEEIEYEEKDNEEKIIEGNKDVEKGLEENSEGQKEEEKNSHNQLEKCELYNEESFSRNLCIKCNNMKGYYFLNIGSIPKKEITDKYIDCVNEETKPLNFYFNRENEDYRICYVTCASCDSGGNWEINNCKTCLENYKKRPDISSTTNCVIKCPFYYYNENNQYKCTKDQYCPIDYILFIKEKGKCINDCKKDDIFKYKYDNQCLKECPKDTIQDSLNHLCKDRKTDISVLTETFHAFLSGNITDEELRQLILNYKNNFDYTNKHVSLYKSNNVSLVIYKDRESLSNLNLEIPKLNFDDCDSKIKDEYNINEDLIILLESEKFYKEGDKIISFSVYDPRNADKIILNDLCKNNPIIIEENIESKITDLDSFIFLANQGIDLLNPNDDFYTDLCFHYISPFDGKEIPLKERFKQFFPNVSLCQKGCSIKGINVTTNTSICECSLDDLINNNVLSDSMFYKNKMAKIKILIEETNIEVIRCYKDLKYIKFYRNNYGSFLIFIFIVVQIILTVIHFQKYVFSMRMYLYNLTQTYLKY